MGTKISEINGIAIDQMTQSVSTSLRYIVPTLIKPTYRASQGGKDAQLDIDVEYDDRTIIVHNARQHSEQASVDTQGFQLLHFPTKLVNFHNFAQQRRRYEEELQELVMPTLGAKEILIFDHTFRSDSAELRAQQNSREATTVIHNDYTDWSARKRLMELVGFERALTRENQRYAIVNVWRSIKGVVKSSPIACCDAQSVNEKDIIPAQRLTNERLGELELVNYNENHKWFYYPDLGYNEAILIKTYDSDHKHHAKRSIHSAFELPKQSSFVPARESIESRMFVFF